MINSVTNFIQLVSPQLVDQFSQTKLCWKALNNDYLYICEIYKSNNKQWDIRLSVTVKVLLANISWMAKQTYTIKLVLESAYQIISDNI